MVSILNTRSLFAFKMLILLQTLTMSALNVVSTLNTSMSALNTCLIYAGFMGFSTFFSFKVLILFCGATMSTLNVLVSTLNILD